MRISLSQFPRYIAPLVACAAAMSPGPSSAEADPTQLHPIPLVFHLPGGDAPSLIVPGSVQVMFKPKELSVKKRVPWGHRDIGDMEAPSLAFTSGKPYSIGLQLLFNTSKSGQSVRELTDKIEELVLGHPDFCLITWGNASLFRCELETYVVRYTLFLPDGTPVRATADVVFSEAKPAKGRDKDPPKEDRNPKH